MAANTQPIYSRIADIQWITGITTANTTQDLTAGTNYLVFTADATNGGYLYSLRFMPIRAIAATTATVAVIWMNNGSTTGTAANNIMIDNISLPAVTTSATVANNVFDVSVMKPIPASYRVYITIHTASANGWMCTAFGGKY